MRIESGLRFNDWGRIVPAVEEMEALGIDRATQPELNSDPFLPLTIAAEHSRSIELATSVAIAFPRSPTVMAYLARGLNDLSQGRFILGLGTQVKGHIVRRFATEWSSPGPRLRDYIDAVRAVWLSWDTGEPLSHNGAFYPLSLMTPEFSPGPSAFAPSPIQIAGVNKYNLRLSGEICDGLRVHPFTTQHYMENVIWPEVRRGAERGQRDLANFEMIGGGFIAIGANDAEVHEARERVRYRIAFYGSTRTYLPVLEIHGWQDLNEKLRRLVADGRWDELASAIPDEILDEFCIAGTYAALLPRIKQRYQGLVDTIQVPLPQNQNDPDFLTLLNDLKALGEAEFGG